MSEKHKRSSRVRLWSLLALLVLIATGCYGTRLGESWPALSVVEVYDESAIVVAYNDKISLVQPRNGALVRLQNAEGEIRFDENDNPRNWEITGGDYEAAQFFAAPLVLNDGEEFLIPAYTERLLTVDTLTAEPDNATGIAALGQIIADVAMQDDVLYVPIKTGMIQAINAETSDTEWTFSAREGIWSAPILEDGILYFGSMDHFVYAVDAESGESVWEDPADLQGAVAAPPLLDGDYLYAGSFSHNLYKIALDGGINGVYEGKNWIWSTPVMYDDTLYYTDLSGYVYAIDPSDMTEIWSVKAAGRGIRSAPIVTDEFVVVGARDGKLYWLDRTDGSVLSEREIEGGGEILSDMLLLEPDDQTNIPEPLIVIGTSDLGHLVMAFPLDYRSGYQGWVYSR